MPRGVYTRNPELRPQTFRACVHCKAVFGPVSHLAVRFCGMKCKAASQRGVPTWNAGKRCAQLDRSETRRCKLCKTEFRATKDWGRRRQLYCSHRCYLANRRVSQFEISVFEYLSGLGIESDRSVRLGRWTFDGMLLETNIVIEADGVFWHSTPKVIERDRRKDDWCASRGLDLIRITDLDFNADRVKACDVAVQRWEKFTGKTAHRA